jgi:hypothetical protein
MTDPVWSHDAARHLDADEVARLVAVIEGESALVVEHRFYAGARAPHRFVCDDPDELIAYLAANARKGDSFYFWKFEDCCRDDNAWTTAKWPDEHGRVPKGGAY